MTDRNDTEESKENTNVMKGMIKEQRSRKIDEIRDKFVMIMSNLTKKKTRLISQR